MRAQQIFALEPTRIRLVENARADVVAHGVVDRVAEYRGDHEHGGENVDVQPGDCDHCPGDEQNRVAGEKQKDDEARFREDDEEQKSIEPRSIFRGELGERLIERQQRIEECRDHRRKNTFVRYALIQRAACSRTTSGSVVSAANILLSHAASLPSPCTSADRDSSAAVDSRPRACGASARSVF